MYAIRSYYAVKGIKAKGKRLSTYEIARIEELEPLRFREEEEPDDDSGEISETEEHDMESPFKPGSTDDAGKGEQMSLGF